MDLGLQNPRPTAMFAPPSPVSVGGIMSMQSATSVLADAKRAMEARFHSEQAQPVISSLVGHIKNFWHIARQNRQTVEQEMLKAIRARRGEYDPTVKAALESQGSSLIYMYLFSTKARQASSLFRDILIGSGSDKPWTIHPTPKPDLPPGEVSQIMQAVAQEVAEAEASGLLVSMQAIKDRLRDARAELESRLNEEAMDKAAAAETKMEDQLLEGGFLEAMDAFLDDMTTFKTAFIKGPVPRMKACMRWTPDGEIETYQDIKLGWERVDPFNIYPAPWAKTVDDAPLIERHKMTREALNELIGVEGYSEAAIRKVLDMYGTGGLHDWLTVDAEKATAEGRNNVTATRSNGLIDALQFWGSVSGKMLREWGMDATQVPDEAKEYQVEAWLIGPHVIKAGINQDPLARRPYYAASYETVPGCFWGNSLYDLIADCQDMCNAAARALVNNMGIASGPQVWVNVERMPAGENITSLYPWKVHQVTSDPMGSTAAPIGFFQPNSNSAELMSVYQQFSILADEYSGIPRYMTGTEGTPGAGRTASGLSMMLSNASKVIRQIISRIDVSVLKPALERLYYYDLRYLKDPDISGDLNIVARGALSLVTKETAQVRRNEFLAQTANPIDMQIIGMEGRAELLRQTAKSLDMNVDRVVPPVSVLKAKAAAQQMLMMQQQAAQQGSPAEPGNGQQLMNGAPVQDAFQPSAA